ncbi:mannonate dehydratase [Chelatococcus asaccharovorans]|uniref:mannonate dehydratase n=1 Tax=Chelatococcus asaccharovorans TaxID=28210 RepID=UPI00224C76B2|nr:mannonate dehydratase [Chelatococcus asaccharovorans]CAH1657655.1 Mannonate dehydratase [Chelatococcus asaccharovorans]CAH1684729.1 Mannonate dehydratase [Chelatococcus asaccharovorans]
MFVGTQFKARTDDDFRVMAQLGVRHVCADPPGNPHDWTFDDLERHRAHIESFGLVLDMVELPLNSRPIEESRSPHILLGKSPERDREIDSICTLLDRVARAGIPAVKYNMNIIGIPRTAPEAGRGGSINEAFRWDKADHEAAPGRAGMLPEDENWERIDYFLARVVPVATAAKVRLACHPHDPYTPPGYRGVTRVLGTVEGLKRFVTMHESPFHGLNFCQGTVGEMLDDPAREIGEVIRWFGERGKLFNVHFRNIRGRRLDFMETFPDEGDMDMVAALKLYADVGYRYMIMPDHAPKVSGADPQGTAFAFCYGYIIGAMQALGLDPHGPKRAPRD